MRLLAECWFCVGEMPDDPDQALVVGCAAGVREWDYWRSMGCPANAGASRRRLLLPPGSVPSPDLPIGRTGLLRPPNFGLLRATWCAAVTPRADRLTSGSRSLRARGLSPPTEVPVGPYRGGDVESASAAGRGGAAAA